MTLKKVDAMILKPSEQFAVMFFGIGHGCSFFRLFGYVLLLCINCVKLFLNVF